MSIRNHGFSSAMFLVVSAVDLSSHHLPLDLGEAIPPAAAPPVRSESASAANLTCFSLFLYILIIVCSFASQQELWMRVLAQEGRTDHESILVLSSKTNRDVCQCVRSLKVNLAQKRLGGLLYH